MISNNTIDIFYEKQHKLALTGLDLKHAVQDLISDISFLYPDLYNTDTVSTINKLCDKFHQQVFSKDGEIS